MGLVSRGEDGCFTIGPLTEEQYRVILDSLELASAWTNRDINSAVANTLFKLISTATLSAENKAHLILSKLPPPASLEIEPSSD